MNGHYYSQQGVMTVSLWHDGSVPSGIGKYGDSKSIRERRVLSTNSFLSAGLEMMLPISASVNPWTLLQINRIMYSTKKPTNGEVLLPCTNVLITLWIRICIGFLLSFFSMFFFSNVTELEAYPIKSAVLIQNKLQW